MMRQVSCCESSGMHWAGMWWDAEVEWRRVDGCGGVCVGVDG